jgi:hypothetical protein
MIPVAQVTSAAPAPTTLGEVAPGRVEEAFGDDLDLVLSGDPATWLDQLAGLILGVASRTYTPRLTAQGNTDFQFTRGLLGVSM